MPTNPYASANSDLYRSADPDYRLAALATQGPIDRPPSLTMGTSGAPGAAPPAAGDPRVAAMQPPPTGPMAPPAMPAGPLTLEQFAAQVFPEYAGPDAPDWIPRGTIDTVRGNYVAYLERMEAVRRQHADYMRNVASNGEWLSEIPRTVEAAAVQELLAGKMDGRAIKLLRELRGLTGQKSFGGVKDTESELLRAALDALADGADETHPAVQAWKLFKAPGSFGSSSKESKEADKVDALLPRAKGGDRVYGGDDTMSAAGVLTEWQNLLDAEEEPAGRAQVWFRAAAAFRSKWQHLAPEGSAERAAFDGWLGTARPKWEPAARYASESMREPEDVAAALLPWLQSEDETEIIDLILDSRAKGFFGEGERGERIASALLESSVSMQTRDQVLQQYRQSQIAKSQDAKDDARRAGLEMRDYDEWPGDEGKQQQKTEQPEKPKRKRPWYAWPSRLWDLPR